MIKITAKINAFEENFACLQSGYVRDKTLDQYINDMLEYLRLRQVDIGVLARHSNLRVMLNLHLIPNENFRDTIVDNGDEINLVFFPKIPAIAFPAGILGSMLLGKIVGFTLAAAANIIIMAGIGYLSYMLMPTTDPFVSGGDIEKSETYTWDGPQTTYAIGRPIPLIYGKAWTAGDILSAQIVGLGIAYGEEDWWSFPHLSDFGIPTGYDWDTCENSAPSVGNPPGITFSLRPEYRYERIRFYFDRKANLDSWPGRSWQISSYVYARTVNTAGNPVDPLPEWAHQDTTYFGRGPEGDDFDMVYSKYSYCEVACDLTNDAGKIYYEFYCGMRVYYSEGEYGGFHAEKWCRPNLVDLQFLGKGPITAIINESEMYQEEEALQVVLGLSDGIINDIELESVYIDDLRLDAFDTTVYDGQVEFDRGLAKTVHVQATHGYNVPLLETPGGSGVIDLFGTKLIHISEFDFMLDRTETKSSIEPLENEFEFDTVSPSVEGFNIILQFPGGLYQVDEGNQGGRNADFWIRYCPFDGDTPDTSRWEYIHGETDKEKNRDDPFLRVRQSTVGEFKITVSAGFGGETLVPAKYRIQVIRKNKVITSIRDGWSESKVIRIQEFSFSRTLHPNTSTIALRILPSEKLSGSIPNFNIPVKGRYVKVPILRDTSGNIVPFQSSYTEWNGGTESYDWKYQVGDAALTIDTTNTLLEYTNCIPFIIYDLLTTQDLYPNIEESDLVWSDFIEAAEICWELIGTDVHSISQERRFQADIVIDTTTDASQILNQLVALMRGRLYWIGSKLRLKVMKPENMTQIFTDADIIPNTYKETYLPDSKIPNTLEVSYYDQGYGERGKQKNLQVSLKDAEHHLGQIKKQSVSLVGVSKQSQALRAASYLLNYASVSNKVIEFKSTMAALASVPGDVVGIQHSTVTYVYGGFFRLESSTGGGSTTFYLDTTVPLTSGQTYIFKIARRTGADAGLPSDPDEYQFTAGASDEVDEITIAETISPNYAVHDTWMLTVTGVAAETYIKKRRIIRIARDVNKEDIVVQCEPYDEDIYADYSVRITPQLPPIKPVDTIHAPADVTDLAATQIFGTYDATITYTVPTSETPLFSSKILSVSGGDTIVYVEASDSQLVSTRNIFVYDGTTGNYKGQLIINVLNKAENTFTYVERETFIGAPATDDFIIQKRSGTYLQINHVEVYLSTDQRNFTHQGNDYSKGKGFIIRSLSPMQTYYIRAESVATTGTKGLNPPTIEFKMGIEECIPSPSHLSICGQGDGVLNFVGCDVCVSWTQSATFEGAGQGIEVEAGVERAGVSESYNITGYQVWIFDNAGDMPQFIREVGTKDTEFEYTHDMNKEDQYNVFARVGKGQRDLLFRVYQVDADGNISCEPSELPLENLAPSMSGYIPTITSPTSGSILVDWSQYVNDPVLFSTDILGFEIWYGESIGDMTSIDVPFTEGETEAKYKITGLTAGTYIVYIIPYDCFGVGTPRSSYKSTTISVTVQGVTQVPYPPPVPQGMTGSMTIDSVDVQAGYYEVRVTADLENDFGFEKVEDPGDPEAAYLAMNYHNDLFYYNTDEDLDGYCYVTGSSLNSNNDVTAIYYSTALSRWCIRVGIPSPAELANYGYEAADGVPQVGQMCTINIWAELAYTNIGGIWDSGLSTVAHAKWQHPDPASAQVNRLSHYEFKIFRADGLLTREYNEPVDDTKVLGGYYTTDIMGIVPEKEIDVSLKLWSDVGDVGTGLYCNDVQVIKETAEYLADQIEVNWSVASLANGSQIQVVIDNWDEYWQDERIKSYEVYACLRQWNFTTSTWEANPVTEFMALKTSGDSNVKSYGEFERTVDGHLRLVNVDDLGDSYFFLGSTEGPIFHWTNAGVSNEGGICTHFSVVTHPSGTTYDSCAMGCHASPNNDINTGNCPYGPADPTLSCCYVNSYYTPDAAADSDRTKEGINYNRYFVTLAVRTTQGRRLWYVDELGNLIWKAADFELIDRMHIADAAITTAKIGDAMINNAKVKHLSAEKVWIGDYAGAYPWQPFKDHCVWDCGSYCKYHGWTEDEEPPIGYYKTGNCPIGVATAPGGCAYTISEFAISRIFAIYGQDPSHNKEYTYINGGMILTNSIRARSIQIGALPYTVDLQVTRLFDDSIEPDEYVRIKWHKSGEYQGVHDGVDPMINGRIEFANDSGFYITAGEYLFTEAANEVPDGTTVKRSIHVGYVEYINAGSHESVLFEQYDLTETVADFNYDGTFSDLRRRGNIPLFSVTIVRNMHTGGGEQAIDGRNLVDPLDIIQSDVGQFKVEIRMVAASPGTYIKNNDITTGVIHNPYWTSYFDMRLYTGYNASDNYKGHSRIVIDGPSSVYERSMMEAHGDNFGREWWEYTTTWPSLYGADTKFLIGRPWIEGLESQLPDIPTDPLIKSARLEGEELADQGYLWFFRAYDKTLDEWIGHLEVGGKLRVKDIQNFREVLVGQAYTQEEDPPYAWVREDSPGIHVYDTEGLYQVTEDSPELLAQIGGETPITVIETSNSAHYFNTDSADRNFTVTIDHDGQVPVDSWTDWGYASLLVVPMKDTAKDHSAGILIRSPCDVTAVWPDTPSYGMVIKGNFYRGLVIQVEQESVSKFMHGMQAGVTNLGSNNILVGVEGWAAAGDHGISVGGNFFASVYTNGAGTIPTATGVMGSAGSDDADNTLKGGVFTASRYQGLGVTATDSTSTTIGVDIWLDTHVMPQEQCAHIHFGDHSGSYNNLPDYSYSGSRPPDSMGKRGDLLASKYRLFYKQHQTDTGTYPNGRWRCIAFGD